MEKYSKFSNVLNVLNSNDLYYININMNPDGTAPITVLSEAHPSSSKLLNVNISASIGVVVVWFYRWST